MVTRRVNEGATVHALSPIRTANHPGSYSLTLRVTNASLTVRVTIATVMAYFIILRKPLSALGEL